MTSLHTWQKENLSDTLCEVVSADKIIIPSSVCIILGILHHVTTKHLLVVHNCYQTYILFAKNIVMIPVS